VSSDAPDAHKKRKLRLMNEVLPAPTPIAHDKSPRERTIARLKHLAGAAEVETEAGADGGAPKK
jgi:hypothetical protein